MSIYFDSTSSQHLETANTLLMGDNEALTFACRFKWDGSLLQQYLAIKGTQTAGSRVLELHLKNITDYLGMNLYDDLAENRSRTQTAAAVSTDKWYHFVATWSATDGVIHFYLDGAELTGGDITVVETNCQSGLHSISNPFRVAVSQYSKYDGFIDHVAVWDRKLTSAEIAFLYKAKVRPNDPRLIHGLDGYWPLDNVDSSEPTVTTGDYWVQNKGGSFGVLELTPSGSPEYSTEQPNGLHFYVRPLQWTHPAPSVSIPRFMQSYKQRVR